jgi:uncharacterized membrane protein
MKKIILLLAITLVGCSNPEVQTAPVITLEEVVSDKNYNNLVYLDGTFEKINSNGDNLPVSIGDPVLTFQKTTNIKITQSTFETNTILPVAYFKNGSTYALPSNTQFFIYETSRIIIKKIEYATSYGKDKRSERYSY